jgi:hypothetical protein
VGIYTHGMGVEYTQGMIGGMLMYVDRQQVRCWHLISYDSLARVHRE